LIDGVEEFFDIRTPHEAILIPTHHSLRSFYRPGQPLILAARPNVVNERFVENRNEVLVGDPMNKPIPDRSHGNFSFLVFVHDEAPVAAMAIVAGIQFAAQLADVLLEVILELVDLGGLPLASSEQVPTFPNI